MKKLKEYAKAIVAALGGVLEAAIQLFPVTSNTGHVLSLIVATLTAAGVYTVRNAPAIADPGTK